MASDAVLILSSFGSLDEARRVARTLVEENLAACANVVPLNESIYRWEGAVETASETLVLFKTTVGCYPGAEARIKELNSYDVPEIIAVAIHSGLPAYLQWLEESCVAGADPL